MWVSAKSNFKHAAPSWNFKHSSFCALPKLLLIPIHDGKLIGATRYQKTTSEKNQKIRIRFIRVNSDLCSNWTRSRWFGDCREAT